MQFKFPLLATMIACAKSVVSENIDFKLFAYGKLPSSGLQMFYGDGQAYVGGTPSFVKQSVDISLSVSKGENKFIAKANKTMPSWSAGLEMYIDLTEGAVNPVGFAHNNETLPGGASSVGFGLYGGWAYHRKENATIEMKFLATPTNETGIYLVKWDAAATKSSHDIPISLRTQNPVVLGGKS